MKINKKNICLNIDDNFYLKILNKNDVSIKYINWMNDYEITKFTKQKFIKHDKHKVENFVEDKLLSKNEYLFGIYFNNSHIGNIKLGEISWKEKDSDLSFFIGDKAYWGKGLATKAVKRILDFAFKEIKLHKIYAIYNEANVSSSKVLNNAGFNIDRIKHNNEYFDGKSYNSILTSIDRNSDDL